MTPNHISGDELSELKRYVLEASRKILVENVDAPRFLPYFRSKFLLDQRECDQIKSCSRQSRYDGAEKLLDVLITKGGTGYDHFCAAIMYDRTQMFLLTTLNKRLEILRDWRKKQVATERHIHQAHEEMMRERAQAHSNRQQQMYNSMYPSGSGRNRTYPLMTATYQGQRHPTQSVPATSRIQVTASNYQSQHHQQNLALPERLPRSPIPMEEPMAPPNTQFLPHPHPNPLVEGPGGNCCYPPFTEPQVAQQHHHQEAHLPHHQQAHSQQIYHHQHHLHRPSVHPSAGQPPSSQQQHGANQTLAGASGYNAAINCPPQAILHGHQYPGYVPPPAPVEPIYPVIMEGGGAYYEQHVPHHNQHYPHHDVLTLNTPTGAMMENLLPGMPPLPTGSASTCSPTAAAPQPMAMPPATTTTDHYMYSQQSEAAGEAEESIHRLPGSSPQYTHSHYGLMLSSPAAPATAADYGNGGTSKDILCGQGGN